jgi:hypothetical protein
LTRSVDFIEQNLINFTYIQEQSTVDSMKKSNADDTAVLITIKNNINSADIAAKSDKFVKCVHSQQTDDE